MISGFKIKQIIAKIFDTVGISELMLKNLSKRYSGKYVRIVNYHHVHNDINFEKQIVYFKKKFDNIDYHSFESFMESGKLPGEKPGIIITFDDGYDDNYEVALRILEEYKMTGWFMVSSDLVGKQGYMDWKQLKDLLNKGHVIGDHTSTHHRMNANDTRESLEYEIIESKNRLEKELEISVNIFCWCGGEEEHYTKNAANIIKEAKFKYGFMTNSYPLTRNTNHFQIQRINIEDEWSMGLVKLQISGFMDKWFENKRNRVNKVTG